MTSSLVGSEMCIRDRLRLVFAWVLFRCGLGHFTAFTVVILSKIGRLSCCLLYTSDAARRYA
eukprot:5118778-Prorocentrum_lima.AAC.1